MILRDNDEAERTKNPPPPPELRQAPETKKGRATAGFLPGALSIYIK